MGEPAAEKRMHESAQGASRLQTQPRVGAMTCESEDSRK